MSDFGTHWCNTCRRFITIERNVVCPLCNGTFIQDLNQLDDPWAPFYEVTQHVWERHGPEIREAASRGRFHLADTTIDEIFNREYHHHGPRRRNGTVDSSARQVSRMNNQINRSNSLALPSDSSSGSLKTIKITQRHVQDGLNCSICLEQFQLGHKVRETKCKHLYHHHCIIPWLAQHKSCPICRFDLCPRPTWWQYAFSFPWQRSGRSSSGSFTSLFLLTFAPINLIIILSVFAYGSINALLERNGYVSDG